MQEKSQDLKFLAARSRCASQCGKFKGVKKNKKHLKSSLVCEKKPQIIIIIIIIIIKNAEKFK